jgi:hypothetical protein
MSASAEPLHALAPLLPTELRREIVARYQRPSHPVHVMLMDCNRRVWRGSPSEVQRARDEYYPGLWSHQHLRIATRISSQYVEEWDGYWSEGEYHPIPDWDDNDEPDEDEQV